MAFATGLALNVANWQTFASIFNVPISDIRNFEIIMAGATALMTIAFILIQFRRHGLRLGFSAPEPDDDDKPTITGWRAPLAMMTPLVPIVLVAALGVPILTSFTVAIIWVLLVTQRSFTRAMNTLTRTCYDGITDAAPAVILMIGIGMLYLSVTHPVVKAVLSPMMTTLTPHSAVVFAVFFAVLAPLALYRGPLNLFGLGSGIAALMSASGLLPVQAVMGGFLSAERIQGVGDPTNTQNVWVSNFVGVDVNTVTKTLLPYLWATSAIGSITAAALYF